METAFGASDAEGAWAWKEAYEACEVAQLLFLRKFGRAMQARATSPGTLLAMLEKIASLLPSHTRRTPESNALQQFSTPITLGHVASVAANLTPADIVLEPSAGTGLLAIFAELAGAASRSTRSLTSASACWPASFPACSSPATTLRRSMIIWVPPCAHPLCS
jgi:hypothetical protein